MDLGGVFDEFRNLPGHEAEEGMQGREPQIPCVGGIAPFLFEVSQKVFMTSTVRCSTVTCVGSVA